MVWSEETGTYVSWPGLKTSFFSQVQVICLLSPFSSGLADGETGSLTKSGKPSSVGNKRMRKRIILGFCLS